MGEAQQAAAHASVQRALEVHLGSSARAGVKPAVGRGISVLITTAAWRIHGTRPDALLPSDKL